MLYFLLFVEVPAFNGSNSSEAGPVATPSRAATPYTDTSTIDDSSAISSDDSDEFTLGHTRLTRNTSSLRGAKRARVQQRGMGRGRAPRRRLGRGRAPRRRLVRNVCTAGRAVGPMGVASSVLDSLSATIWEKKEPSSLSRNYILTPGPTTPVDRSMMAVDLFCRFFFYRCSFGPNS